MAHDPLSSAAGPARPAMTTPDPHLGPLRVAAIVAGILAMAPATWWVIGLMRGEISPHENLEPLLPPPDLGGGAELAVGLVSLTVVVAAVVVLRGIAGEEHLPREWLGVIYPLAALSGYAGMTYRLSTAAFVGADVGAGVLLWLAAPFVFVMGSFVAVSLWTMSHRPSDRD